MFVRRKGKFHYLVEALREGSRVRQRVLAYLGRYPTIELALTDGASDVERFRTKAAEAEKEAQSILTEAMEEAERFATESRAQLTAQIERRAAVAAVHQLRQRVRQAARAHVVDGEDRVLRAQGPAAVDHLLAAPLHLGVVPLDRGEVEVLLHDHVRIRPDAQFVAQLFEPLPLAAVGGEAQAELVSCEIAQNLDLDQ